MLVTPTFSKEIDTDKHVCTPFLYAWQTKTDEWFGRAWCGGKGCGWGIERFK